MLLAVLVALPAIAQAQDQVPKPSDVFGFEVGADYKLATYDQMLEYYDRLAEASDRVELITIGQSSMGRPMKLFFISSEENIANLDRYREISEKMARARISEQEARKLADEGKAVVWIDGGMHATELAHGQMTSELAWRIATEETPEMQKIRDRVITMIMPVMNPDGVKIVGDWYRKQLGTPFETTGPPWLYQKYVGHDNNRDWFMNNMPETYQVNEVLYHRWYPQIVYNQHQTAPSWARIFLPPFSDPVNPNIHPGVTTGVNEVGSAMSRYFALEDMPGAVSDNTYTMFWNGGGRTTPYYHNMIGILTETAHATPTPRFYDPDSMPEYIGRGIPADGTDIFYPDPWKGGESHFRDAVDYMITGSLAVLDHAADRKTNYLYNIYRMGRDAINKGKSGNPWAYIIPQEQWDGGEAINLVNILYRGGIEISQANDEFEAGGKEYPAGTYVIETAQAFRPFLLDMMEPQNYPTLLEYPGGPPDPPYDLAGWTLPMQMGVTADRIEKSFDYSGNAVTGLVDPEAGELDGRSNYGWALSHKPNASAKATNRLLAQGHTVYWTKSATEGRNGLEAASIIIERGDGTEEAVRQLAEETGLDFTGLRDRPDTELYRLSRPKVGLYKSWQANMDEGWTRWLLQNYEFDVDTLHNKQVQEGDLSQYDAIIIPDQRPDGIMNGHEPGTMPEKYTGGVGLKGALALQEFVKGGGTLLAFDSASDFVIQQFGLPVRNAVSGLSNHSFFIPGSLIRASVSNDHPMAYGMQPEAAASFSHSRAFSVIKIDREGEGGKEDIKKAPEPPIDVPVRYAEDDLLMSGWAMGEKRYLGGKPAMMNIGYGEGNIVLYGFRPQFRGQPRGTYKLIFNPLFMSTMEQDMVSFDTPLSITE